MEAQRYPDDFDVIIAGAPVYDMVHLNVSQTALQVHVRATDRIIPQNKVTLIASAAWRRATAATGSRRHHQRPAPCTSIQERRRARPAMPKIV